MKLKKLRQKSALERLRVQIDTGMKRNKDIDEKLTDADVKRILAEIAILEKRV